jgi:TusA-related sulfurtransferase
MSENERYCDKEIDLSGLHGLEVELRTKIEIDRLSIGGRLKVVSDDPESGEDISSRVERTGYELVSLHGNAGGEFQFLIRKAV